MSVPRTRLSPRPIDHFSDAADWPHVTPTESTVEAYYAAVLAQTIERAAQQRADGSLTKGMQALARDCGIPFTTLRYIETGERWPTLQVLARLEWFLQDWATGYGLVNSDLRRHERGLALRMSPSAHDPRSGARGE